MFHVSPVFLLPAVQQQSPIKNLDSVPSELLFLQLKASTCCLTSYLWESVSVHRTYLSRYHLKQGRSTLNIQQSSTTRQQENREMSYRPVKRYSVEDFPPASRKTTPISIFHWILNAIISVEFLHPTVQEDQLFNFPI